MMPTNKTGVDDSDAMKTISWWKGLYSLGPTPLQVPPAGYAYACEDKSVLKPVFYRLFVNPMSSLLPKQMSANDVTWISQLFALMPVVIGLLSVSMGLPWWVFGVLAPLGYIGYIVFDHLDGTHARKTKTSSPLGELVDHWCDAWNSALLCCFWGLNWGAHPVMAVSLGFVTAFALALTYEEQRVTGKMKLDAVGGNEAMTSMWLSMIAMGIFGKEVMISKPLPFGLTVGLALQLVCLFGSSGAIISVLVRSGAKLLVNVWPFVAGSALILGWVALGLDARLAGFMMAGLVAIVAGRVVLERVTGLPVRIDWVSLFLLIVGFVLGVVRAPSHVHWIAGSVITAALVVRACADFMWGATSTRKYVRRGELLSLVVRPSKLDA